MKNKYLVWYSIPIFLIGSFIIDIVYATPDIMFPLIIFAIPFSLGLFLMGWVYYFLKKENDNNKIEKIIDFSVLYTAFLPLIFLCWVVLNSTFNLHVEKNIQVILFFFAMALGYLYVFVQCLALVLLLYVLVKNRM